MMADANPKIIEVTMKVQFIVPMHNGTISQINGWTLEEIIDDWFKRRGPNGYHATRDRFEIGNSKEILNIEVKQS
jgi:hypothetical protein